MATQRAEALLRDPAVSDERTQVLYLRPGVDADRLGAATVDSFAGLDRARWSAHLIITESSPNRLLHRLEPLAGEEVLDLPGELTGEDFPAFILGFLESRGVRLLNLAGARLGFDLLPDVAGLPDPPAVVVDLAAEEAGPWSYVRHAARRYGDLIDAFLVADESMKMEVVGYEIPPSRISVVPADPRNVSVFQGEVYERLRDGWPTGGFRPAATPEPNARDAPARLALPRDPPPERTVGVSVYCAGDGIYLDECIHSIKLQFLRPRHVVVIDAGSEDPETLEALGRLDSDPSLTVLRQPPGLGPGAARNRALSIFDTDYALWIDAKDQLLPGALDSMIAKLECAPEDVGFIYPHRKHTGSRTDYVESPAYDLWLLMQDDACTLPSMYDMRVFEGTGVAFPEDVASHESWDLALQLAERDVRGQPADGPTFLARERGFSRAQALDRGACAPRRAVEERHAPLFHPRTGPAEDSPAIWAPPDTQPLCRHLSLDGGARIVTNDRRPPSGFRLELELGVTHTIPLPGAQRLVARAGTFELSDEQDELIEGHGLGYLESRPFPLCERLELCAMPECGERVLVAGPEDPLYGVARPIAFLGWVQAFPPQPGGDVGTARAVALRRQLDGEACRHLYMVDLPEGGPPAVTIGSLSGYSGEDLVALRLREDGRLASDLARPGRATRNPLVLACWMARPPAPDRDRYWSPVARARRLVRHWSGRRLSDDEGVTLGWLRRNGSPGTHPLFSATHPATGDQLVTRDPQKAVTLGYRIDGALGFIYAAGQDDEPERYVPAVPWAGG